MRQLLALFLLSSWASVSLAQDIPVAWLKIEQELPPTLSNLDPIPENLGLAGVLTALKDNETTGKFQGQDWSLAEHTAILGDDVLEVARAAHGCSCADVSEEALERSGHDRGRASARSGLCQRDGGIAGEVRA